jgi:hypothetical protein
MEIVWKWHAFPSQGKQANDLFISNEQIIIS